MVLKKYNIKLKRLEYSDIEMVRQWRNLSNVNKFMNFRDYISIDMQKQWFNSLDNTKDYFFVIYHMDYPVGLTEIKHISDNQSADLGIFIADEDSLKIPLLSYRAIFTIIDFAFYNLELTQLTATVLKNNTRAIKFNKSFGFQNIQNANDTQILHFILKKDIYEYKSKPIKKLLDR
jgi:RimJ/RimL family protein N-acetyltransferase